MAINLDICLDLSEPVTTYELLSINEGFEENSRLALINNQDDTKEQFSLVLGSDEYKEYVLDSDNIPELQHDIINIKKLDVKFFKLSKKRTFTLRGMLQEKVAKEAVDKIKDCENKASKIAKTRKYTKEMQNRDIIEKSSNKMQKQAEKTVDIADNKFAESAKHPNRKFDDIIYNSPTQKMAKKQVFDDFEDISDIDD